jgi:hypothetical protein
MNTSYALHAFFSPNGCRSFGFVTYLDINGNEVDCTEIRSDGIVCPHTKAKDCEYVGCVFNFVATWEQNKKRKKHPIFKGMPLDNWDPDKTFNSSSW